MRAAFLEEVEKMGMRDIPVPEIGPDDVLVRIKAAGVCGSDLHAYIGKHIFRFPPVMLGHEGAGVIAKIGENVTGFQIGDRVTVDPTIPCGKCRCCREGNTNLCPDRVAPGTKAWWGGMGTWGDYFPIRADHVYHIGDDVSFAKAALCEPMANSMHIISQIQGKEKNSICVIGCGTIGLFAVLLAKHAGYKTVIGSDPVAFNRETAEKVGADLTVDPIHQDIEKIILDATNGEGVDVTIVAAGAPGILDQAIHLTKRTGEIMLIAMMSEPIAFDSWALLSRQQSLRGSMLYNTPDFEACLKLINEGIDLSPFMTHSMPVEEAGRALELLKNRNENVVKITLTLD